MNKLSKLACRLGFHKWVLRELHYSEKYRQTSLPVRMVILERCECGAARIPPRGHEMPTIRCISTKYVPDDLALGGNHNAE